MATKVRRVQCSGALKRGRFTGERCSRVAILPVDKSNNTKLWYCKGHAGQRGRPR